jgi:hypothetical protein
MDGRDQQQEGSCTNVIMPECCKKQFSRTVFYGFPALFAYAKDGNVDALEELGIILSAWHSRTSRSNTPLVAKEIIDARLHS